MNVKVDRRGGASAASHRRSATLPVLVRAESSSHGPAWVGFGYERDAWSPVVSGRSLSAEVLISGIGGSVIA